MAASFLSPVFARILFGLLATLTTKPQCCFRILITAYRQLRKRGWAILRPVPVLGSSSLMASDDPVGVDAVDMARMADSSPSSAGRIEGNEAEGGRSFALGSIHEPCVPANPAILAGISW